MRPSAAVDAARAIFAEARAAEAPRLDRIVDAMRPSVRPRGLGDGVFGAALDGTTDLLVGPGRIRVPADAPPVMRSLALKSGTNFLPLVVDTFGQVMKVDGLYTTGSADRSKAWAYWQRNGMDARQAGVHRSALQFGVSYVTVLPGTAAPVMRGVSPRRMTALYQDDVVDEYPMQALEVIPTAGGPAKRARLYDEEFVYEFGAEYGLDGAAWDFIEARPHSMGVTPVVRFRDRMLLDGEEQLGIVEPLISIQERIDETTFGMMVAQYFTAFKQRYIIGWVPKSEDEKLRASAARLWTFDESPSDMQLGEFSEAGPSGYIESKNSAIRDLSAIGQVPAQALGVDGVSNVSAEALASLQDGRDRKADEITTSFGESWESSLRLCGVADGDADIADDFSSEVKWKDATARSFAQTVDGLGKLAQMLSVPVELLWEQIPGWTDATVERAKTLVEGDDPVLASVLRGVNDTGGFGGASGGEEAAGSAGEALR